jgi:hypothetical protein
MDLEDDTHMNTETNPENYCFVVNVKPSDALIEVLLEKLKPYINEVMDERIDEWMHHDFDINDHTHNLDLDRLTTNIVDDVIDAIKERL